MWPSEAWAIWWYDKANLALVVALITGAAATALIVWMGNVKEDYLKKELAQTNERAGLANKRAAQLEIDAAEINRKAEAEKLERIKLEASLAWRVIPKDKYPEIVAGLAKTPRSVTVTWLANDIESMQYAHQIIDILRQAKWNILGGGAGLFLEPMIGAFVTGNDEKAMINLQGHLGRFGAAPIFAPKLPKPRLSDFPADLPADMHILIARTVRPSEKELLLGAPMQDKDKIGRVLLKAAPPP